jgi:hypothetical protein
MQNLLTSLCSASAEISNPVRDSKNPHFRNSYASLESVLDAVCGPLQRHGLVLTQTTEPAEGGDVLLRTTLWHAKTAERLDSTLLLNPAKRDPQGVAAAATYYRRLAIKALLGLAETDDDGNEASGHQPQAKPQQAKPRPAAVDNVVAKMGGEVVETGMEIIGAMREAKSVDALNVIAKRAKQLPDAERAEARAVYTDMLARLGG